MHSEMASLAHHIELLDCELRRQTRNDDRLKTLQRISGIGPILAGTILAEIGDAKRLRRARPQGQPASRDSYPKHPLDVERAEEVDANIADDVNKKLRSPTVTDRCGRARAGSGGTGRVARPRHGLPGRPHRPGAIRPCALCPIPKSGVVMRRRHGDAWVPDGILVLDLEGELIAGLDTFLDPGPPGRRI
jgi:hypothetical protein